MWLSKFFYDLVIGQWEKGSLQCRGHSYKYMLSKCKNKRPKMKSSTLNIEAVCFSENSVSANKFTLSYNPRPWSTNHRLQNLKSRETVFWGNPYVRSDLGRHLPCMESQCFLYCWCSRKDGLDTSHSLMKISYSEVRRGSASVWHACSLGNHTVRLGIKTFSM